MYRSLLGALIVVVVSGWGLAQAKEEPAAQPAVTTPTKPAAPVTADFALARDARITCHPSEANYNSGKANRLRTVGIQKASAEVVIMDFDHAALKAFLGKHAAREITGKLTLTVYQVQNGPGKVEVAALDSAVDWNEGEHTQEAAAKGECCCAAAQKDVKPWTTVDGKEVKSLIDLLYDKKADKIKTLLNSSSVEVSDQKEVTIDLDAALVKHLVTDANCRGLVLFNRSPSAKVDFYSRDQRNRAPKLTLIATEDTGTIILDVKTFKLEEADVKDLAGATGGKAVLFAKETSAAKTTVDLKKGTYEVTLYLQGADEQQDAVYLSVAGVEARVFPDEYGKVVPAKTFTVEVAKDGPATVALMAAETGVYLDRVVLKKVK